MISVGIMLIFMIISAIVAVISTVIGVFVGNIILFDSIGLSIIAGVCAKTLLHIHPAFCLLIGIGMFLLLLGLQKTK